MTAVRDDLFNRFSHSFERCKNLARPTGNLTDAQAPTYPIELALDHIASHLLAVGNDAAGSSTKIDWPKIVPENLADLDAVQTSLDSLAITEGQKAPFRSYISECRALWEQMRSLPVPPEGHLGFRKAALDYFQFLEAYGFQVTESTPIRVRYQSATLFVELEYSLECPELTFSLGNLPEGGGSHLFSLDDFLYAAGLGLSFNYGRFNLESRSGVKALLDWAAQFIKDHAQSVLRNESGSFQLILAKQNEREQALTEAD